MLLRLTFAGLMVVTALAAQGIAGAWEPVAGNIMSRWAEDVSPDDVWPEYPRPQLVRDEWSSLNGLWEYAITARDAEEPVDMDGEILVPFAAQSALSGVKKPVGPDERLWYRREFDVPADWAGRRTRLNFGAVDWEAVVTVNGEDVGTHRGGYSPFAIDITDVLKPEGPQEIAVAVWDPTDRGTQARGKQVLEPQGIWYTAVTGIWQTVWLEPVPEARIERLVTIPDIDASTVSIEAVTEGAGDGDVIQVSVMDGHTIVQQAAGAAGGPIEVDVPDANLWSPDDPFLYRLRVKLIRDGAVVDDVESYFGMRKISVVKDAAGIPRLALNNDVLFQYGPLDQGWWPDGLYTAPTDEALRYDLEVTKDLGFNMIRKHVKVEPERWYLHCDELGILVWQDMPSGNGGNEEEGEDGERQTEHAEQFETELREVMDFLISHPCIVAWVPFNEGWGQYDTARITEWVKAHDPSRLVNPASGWADRGCGDIKDKHSYPNPTPPEVEEDRASVQGEYGGLGLPVEGHLWWDKRNWGYRTYDERQVLADNYLSVVTQLRNTIGEGCCAGVYTQTTDCEGEVNGLMTYDRAVIKFDPEWMAEVNARLYLPAPVVTVSVPTSQREAQEWRYTEADPGEGWEGPDFDDTAWEVSRGGFGTEGTPGSVVGTEWRSADIWIRREFSLDVVPDGLQLRVHHDEDAQVYTNGTLVAELTGYVTGYVDVPLGDEAVEALREGMNTIAIHCHQTTGGQFIDAGFVTYQERRAD